MKKCVMLVFLVLDAVVLAEDMPLVFEREAVFDRPQGLSLGAGALVSQKPYKGSDTEVRPIPLINYFSDDFYIQALEFGYYLYDRDNLVLAAVAKPRLEGFDADDSSDLDGMSDRKPAFDGGLSLEYDFDSVVLSADFSGDLTGRYKGWEFELALAKSFRNAFCVEKLRLTLASGLSWRSKQLNDYYYGVRTSEVRPSRNSYQAGSSVNPMVSASANYELDDKWSVFFTAKCEFLAGEITKSPIVNEHQNISTIVGLIRKF